LGSGVTPDITRSKVEPETPFCSAFWRIPATQESKSAVAGEAAETTSAAIASARPARTGLSDRGLTRSEAELRRQRGARAVQPARRVEVPARREERIARRQPRLQRGVVLRIGREDDVGETHGLCMAARGDERSGAREDGIRAPEQRHQLAIRHL